MKTKLLIPLLAAALLCGCATNPRPIVTVIVKDGVRFGVSRSPQAVPYLQAVTPVICSVANSTNLTPESLVAAIDAIPFAKPPEAGLIIDFVVGTYDGYFEQYVDTWTSQRPLLKNVLLGCCDGLTLGLFPPPLMLARRQWTPPHTR